MPIPATLVFANLFREMRRQARMKRRKNLPAKTSNFVTRDQLVDLRDELEEMYDEYLRRVEYNRGILERADITYQKVHSLSERTDRAIRDINRVLGIETDAPRRGVMREAPSWAVFHAWIGRMNERFDKIDARLDKIETAVERRAADDDTNRPKAGGSLPRGRRAGGAADRKE
jgi:hypothetical protein